MVKPWLLLPPKLSHDLGPFFLKIRGKFKPLKTHTWKPFTWEEIEFTNPLGIAGGVDKNAESVEDWWTYGPGFIEVGTVTPLPQDGNEGPTLDRNNRQQALWNRMGFPNKGMDEIAEHLKKLYQPHFTPIFVNIGKNRTTKLEDASQDYIKLINKFCNIADCFVVNISSPNTQGLRDLLNEENFRNFLKPIIEANNSLREKTINGNPPAMLVKVSPDLEGQQLENVLNVGTELGVKGWILTNTTTSRSSSSRFPKEGGVSGSPLASLSKQTLQESIRILGDRRKGQLIISCGGVLTSKDVFERLEMGADLVQVYSALVFTGPKFFQHVADKAND